MTSYYDQVQIIINNERNHTSNTTVKGNNKQCLIFNLTIFINIINISLNTTMQTKGWKMAKQQIYTNHPFFKIKWLKDQSLMVHFPKNKQITFYNAQLEKIKRPIKFSHKFNAIELINLDSKEYAVAGLNNGAIESVQSTNKQGDQAHTFSLNLHDEMGEDIYINDLLYLGNNRLMSIYNSGNAAIWDISSAQHQSQPLHFIPKVHKSYFYKIRRVNELQIVTCGQDGYTKVMDIEEGKIVNSFCNVGSVWCCYPFSENLLCSGGLMDAIYFWDIRMARMVQATPLKHRESSFITSLSSNSIVFGDRKQITRCDLRMAISQLHSLEHNMLVSAQSIVVRGSGGFAAGRGGDLCKFVSSDEDVQLKRQTININMNDLPPSFNFLHRQMANIQHLLGMNNLLNPVFVNDEDMDDQHQREWDQQDYNQHELDEPEQDEQQQWLIEDFEEDDNEMEIRTQNNIQNQLNNVNPTNNLNRLNEIDVEDNNQVPQIVLDEYQDQQDWQDISSQSQQQQLQDEQDWQDIDDQQQQKH